MLSYLFSDGSIKEAGLIPGVKAATDFSFNRPNRKIFFVADPYNGRILQVDHTAPIAANPPTIGTRSYGNDDFRHVHKAHQRSW
jgi:hypothetical protein